MKKIKDEDIIRLHKKGWTDRKIADELKVTQAAINYRRTKLGLKNNYVERIFSDEKLVDLWNKGWTDREIAEELEVTPAAVNYRRVRLHLQSNYLRPEKFKKMKDVMSLDEIAKITGIQEIALKHLQDVMQEGG